MSWPRFYRFVGDAIGTVADGLHSLAEGCYIAADHLDDVREVA